jgi:hypothetical protein
MNNINLGIKFGYCNTENRKSGKILKGFLREEKELLNHSFLSRMHQSEMS